MKKIIFALISAASIIYVGMIAITLISDKKWEFDFTDDDKWIGGC